MRTRQVLVAALSICLLTLSATAGDIPRAANLVKETGNQFLSAKRYADAIDSYFQALEICPDYPEAHYNLGVSFLKGYKAFKLARYHFQRYLDLSPTADDRESVLALVNSLAEHTTRPPDGDRTVVEVVAGRLLVSGTGWVKQGDRIEVAEKGKDPCACLIADYVYPDGVLTQRVWDERTLETIRPGLLAANVSP
ncbi:MAG: tetratricopeptide repeat protein [Deltaproteobacteria bacterium]|nr:tetratricopeptide repeat protein [Deltaproteobacteria bacterium]